MVAGQQIASERSRRLTSPLTLTGWRSIALRVACDSMVGEYQLGKGLGERGKERKRESARVRKRKREGGSERLFSSCGLLPWVSSWGVISRFRWQGPETCCCFFDIQVTQGAQQAISPVARSRTLHLTLFLFLTFSLRLFPSVHHAFNPQHAVYRGTLDAFRKIVRLEGFRALYKGFLPATLGIGAGQL